MDLNLYRFRSEWQVDASPDEAYRALEELRDYPAWWPEVRAVEKLDERSYRLRCRSTLPYDLVFTTIQSRRDPEAHVLEAHMEGDLEGFSRWTMHPSGTGTKLIFEEEVVANKKLLRRLALIARPAFKANHSLMMYHGRKGLRTYLAGYRLGRASTDS